MRALADSGETEAEVRGERFRAADLRTDPTDTFMTGLIGFVERETFRQFEDEAFSWIKGQTEEVEGATTATVVPFAIDLREHRRWTAFVVSTRIRSNVFRSALAATLNAAADTLGLLPTEWEVDTVLSVSTIEDWVTEHPEIIEFTRSVRLTNALKDVDEARRKMRELAATKQSETFKPPRGGALEIAANPVFEEMIGGVATGDMDVLLVARFGGAQVRFRSIDHADRIAIDEYGVDLERGVELVLRVLQEFSEQRGDVMYGDRETDTA